MHPAKMDERKVKCIYRGFRLFCLPICPSIRPFDKVAYSLSIFELSKRERLLELILDETLHLTLRENLKFSSWTSGILHHLISIIHNLTSTTKPYHLYDPLTSITNPSPPALPPYLCYQTNPSPLPSSKSISTSLFQNLPTLITFFQKLATTTTTTLHLSKPM